MPALLAAHPNFSMISSKKLLTDLKKQVTLRKDDLLRQRCKDSPCVSRSHRV